MVEEGQMESAGDTEVRPLTWVLEVRVFPGKLTPEGE